MVMMNAGNYGNQGQNAAMYKLPPLNALRTFCAVGQKRTFAEAAEMLGVSPSAVSQQIKSLESWVGVALFERTAGHVTLNEPGRQYYNQVWQSLSMIEDATNDLRGTSDQGRLNISVLPSFASQWLVPRLRSFKQAHPQIDVAISTTNDLVDFSTEDVDLAIRYGHGEYPGLHARKLLTEAVNVVCTQKAYETWQDAVSGRNDLSGLGRLPFVDDGSSRVKFKSGLNDWMQAKGFDGQKISFEYSFTDSQIAIEHAILHDMFILARLSLVLGKLEEGALLAPFGAWLQEEAAYYAVYPEHRPLRPIAKLFLSWLATACSDWVRQAEQYTAG